MTDIETILQATLSNLDKVSKITYMHKMNYQTDEERSFEPPKEDGWSEFRLEVEFKK